MGIGIVWLASAACATSEDAAPAPGEAQRVQDAVMTVSAAVQHDVSGPLRDAPLLHSAAHRAERPLRLLGVSGPEVDDAIVQATPGASAPTTNGLNFAGVGDGDYGFTPDAAPPDTDGAVGATQYVQWVNESFAVFDKATGAIAPGFPKTGNSIWAGFGGGCETNNDGDPIVQYDKAAQRWILTQFSVSTTPFLQCVAVSTTSDATGSYARYAFQYANFPDYPKLSVWPDAYYITFNVFGANSFIGALACAYDRAKMLAGQPATQVCFQQPSAVSSLLASDLDGSTPPAAGAPNVLLGLASSTALNMFRFHVDFATPGNSTFSGPTTIPVAAFNEACRNGGACIPQLGTSEQLDSLSDRLMYRLAYRRFADHEALVVSHSVSVGRKGPSGIRWYELRAPGNGAFTLFQSGTFAPDTTWRWMPSIAMDKLGDIAVGYSTSSSTLDPGIRYTVRTPGDPAGTLENENVLVNGGGAQLVGLDRWGDYSAMTIDPVDDCTFWYTNEYLKANGTFNWSTRIASFKVAGCQ
ncbi:MAG TPA: hypothetical protein VFP84_16385 [Kofleriaceae bacterium]|nr:hypothetical protein [Kofleriaceae bacterium]